MIAALASFAVLAAVMWPLERLFPARAQSSRWHRRALSIDTLYFFGQYLVWTGLIVAALAAVHPWLGQVLPVAWRVAFGSQPAVLQVVEGIVVADLCAYGFHRACHRFELLWRFHAVHHSAPEVDWLAAHREHPVDGLFTHLALNVPLLLLGVPLAWLAGLVAFRGLWAIFVHSNVKLPLGPLLYLFGSPQLHRWHHSRDGMARHNFANLAPYVDLLFGTFYRPAAAGDETWEVGLGERYPSSYPGQLWRPFVMPSAASSTKPNSSRAAEESGTPNAASVVR